MSARRIPPLHRDAVFLLLGGAWGTWTVVTSGPWPIMLISAATMLGPGFLRLWLSGTDTGDRLPSVPQVLSGPQQSSLPGSPSTAPEGEP